MKWFYNLIIEFNNSFGKYHSVYELPIFKLKSMYQMLIIQLLSINYINIRNLVTSPFF